MDCQLNIRISSCANSQSKGRKNGTAKARNGKRVDDISTTLEAISDLCIMHGLHVSMNGA